MIGHAIQATVTDTYSKVSDTSKRYDHPVPIAVWSGAAATTDDPPGFYIAQDSAGTGERFIPAGNGYADASVIIDPDGGILWAKALTGTTLTLNVAIGRP